jgi:FAD/FMN-containing dehydrogenase
LESSKHRWELHGKITHHKKVSFGDSPTNLRKGMTVLKKLQSLGIEVLVEAEDLENYGRDWTRFHKVATCGIAFPKSTDEVSAILKACGAQGLPVVPSGGRTGLAAGAVATQGELVVNLSRMNRILDWDPLSLTLHVEAGIVHEAVQEFLRPQGLHWPVDLASKGSCQIGGNLATNAGGLRVIRYGHARRWVQSLKVVLADGRLMELHGPVEKNNAGTSLRDLFIGSEGTLGIIVEARLRAASLPKNRLTLLTSVPSLPAALEILKELRKKQLPILAFEFFRENCLQRVLEKTQLRPPFRNSSAAAVLMDLELADVSEIPESLSTADTIVAETEEQARNLWAYRENITESLAQLGFVYKHDLALPLRKMPAFVEKVESEFSQRFPGAELYLFGHLGDGNLHLNVVWPKKDPDGKLLSLCEKQNEWIFSEVVALQGSISAEHGLGLLKRKYLSFAKSPTELEMLRKLRKVFDPQGLLNPGKGIE